MDAPTRLYVGNLPYQVQEEDVAAFFADNSIEITKIDISIDPFTGRNPSYCFVEFPPHIDTASVIATCQGKPLRGRPVKINHKTEKRTPTSRLPTKSYDQGWRPVEVDTDNVPPAASFAFDRWNRHDAKSHWTAPLQDKRRLYVGGMARVPNQDAVNAEIRELFAGFEVQAVSKLVSPHPSKYSEPGSHYYCFVDFPTAQEAQAAMEQQRDTATPYGGRYRIRVAHFGAKTTVEREQLGGNGSGAFADTRRARSSPPPPQPPRTRNLAGSWRRQE